MDNLTNELNQVFTNDNGTIKIEVLYNNTFDFFYFEVYENNILIQGDKKIVNDYEDDYVKIYSLMMADYGSFESIETFTIEVKNEE